jgi:uncharacterized damage-inducible protein DinB
MPAETASKLFLEQAVWRLREDYPPKLRRCLEGLTEEQVWWRPNPACNSVGNLLLHLAGNLRQWVVAGLGGAPDRRDRPAEFRAAGPVPKAELLADLEQALADTCTVIAGLDDSELVRSRRIQVYENRTGLEAVFHVVEHFSGHLGQIIYITKLLDGQDLGFYGYLNP